MQNAGVPWLEMRIYININNNYHYDSYAGFSTGDFHGNMMTSNMDLAGKATMTL